TGSGSDLVLTEAIEANGTGSGSDLVLTEAIEANGTGSGSDLVLTEAIDSAITQSLPLPVPYHSELPKLFAEAPRADADQHSRESNQCEHLRPKHLDASAPQ